MRVSEGLQVQFSQASFVTRDRDAATQSRTVHSPIALTPTKQTLSTNRLHRKKLSCIYAVNEDFKPIYKIF